MSSLPYDVPTDAEARAEAARHPRTFLRIIRPEINVPPDRAPHAEALYDLAASHFRSWIEEGWLVQDSQPRLYVYRLKTSSHEQHGVVGCLDVRDYESGWIRRHEQTREDKLQDQRRLMLALRAHTGLIHLAYRDHPALDALAAESEQAIPLLDFVADGVQHTVWPCLRADDVRRRFEEVGACYVADGHHRAEAAAQVARALRRAETDAHDDAEWTGFPGTLFPASQLRIYPYHRCLRRLDGWTEARLLEACRRVFRVERHPGPLVPRPGMLGLYVRSGWHSLSRLDLDRPPEDPVLRLDVDYLQRHLLAPLLGITDARRDPRLDFAGGSDGMADLVRRVDGGEAAAAFALHPVSVEQMMDIADAGLILPPKSTWFDPKLRSGLLVHTF